MRVTKCLVWSMVYTVVICWMCLYNINLVCFTVPHADLLCYGNEIKMENIYKTSVCFIPYHLGCSGLPWVWRSFQSCSLRGACAGGPHGSGPPGTRWQRAAQSGLSALWLREGWQKPDRWSLKWRGGDADFSEQLMQPTTYRWWDDTPTPPHGCLLHNRSWWTGASVSKNQSSRHGNSVTLSHASYRHTCAVRKD